MQQQGVGADVGQHHAVVGRERLGGRREVARRDMRGHEVDGPAAALERRRAASATPSSYSVVVKLSKPFWWIEWTVQDSPGDQYAFRHQNLPSVARHGFALDQFDRQARQHRRRLAVQQRAAAPGSRARPSSSIGWRIAVSGGSSSSPISGMSSKPTSDMSSGIETPACAQRPAARRWRGSRCEAKIAVGGVGSSRNRERRLSREVGRKAAAAHDSGAPESPASFMART